jgi:predicted Fe-Mo cluster-binding NifX family protein
MRTGDLKKAHAISHQIESEIRKQVPHVERVVIHYEPEVRKHLRVAVPLADTTGRVSTHFGEAPYFALVLLRLADGQIERQEVVSNPHTEVPRARGIRVAEWLVKQRVDVVAVREDLHNKGPTYVFSDAGVEVKVLPNDRLDSVLESFRKQEGVSD